jgi:hypothetical protein
MVVCDSTQRQRVVEEFYSVQQRLRETQPEKHLAVISDSFPDELLARGIETYVRL